MIQMESWLRTFLNPLEDRPHILATYFNVPIVQISSLATIPYGEQRKTLCKAGGIDPYVFRTMIDYTRYPEAVALARALRESGRLFRGMRILDFGCLVSDYGICFARMEAIVTAYDSESVISFVRFRYGKESLPVLCRTIPENVNTLVAGQELVIFGEVLEHLSDPLSALEACVSNQVEYIFTSCYPYGEDQYFNIPGHKQSAQLQQEDCIRLLHELYSPEVLRRTARLWRRKALRNG
jgi:hypothetical protein